MDAIIKDFGSYENMKARLSTATVAVQGSGWGWLVSKLMFDLLKYLTQKMRQFPGRPFKILIYREQPLSIGLHVVANGIDVFGMTKCDAQL